MARVLLTTLTGVVVAGCDSLFGPDRREFVIAIDSISAPGAVSGGAPWQVLFYGPIGPNTCHSFKEFKVMRSASSADVTVIGQSVDGTCGQMPQFLDGMALTIEPPVSDPFTLRVHQPNRSVLPTLVRAE